MFHGGLVRQNISPAGFLASGRWQMKMISHETSLTLNSLFNKGFSPNW